MPRKKKRDRTLRPGSGRRCESWAPAGCGPNGWMNRELKVLHPAVTPTERNKNATFFNRRANQYTTACASLLMKAVDACHVRPIKAELAGYLNANGIPTFRGQAWKRTNVIRMLVRTGLMQYVDDAKATYELREAAVLAGLYGSQSEQ